MVVDISHNSASFSRRNRSKIAVPQSQTSHWAKKIAAIRNHTLVVATYFGWFPDVCDASETLQKPRKTGGSRVQRVGFRGCFLSRSDFFELRLRSLAICDFEVAAIRVTKHTILPKGPFDTKNATVPETVVFCYRGSILLSILIRCRFFPGKTASKLLSR